MEQPLYLSMFIYIIILLIFLILLSPNKPNKPDFYIKLLYMATHYLNESLQLPLTLLFIQLKNTLVRYVEMRLQMKTAQSNVIYVTSGPILSA